MLGDVKAAVFGLGRVGCVTAACLARGGHEVIGVDPDPDKVMAICSGQSPIAEPGLSALIANVTKAGRLTATTDARVALKGAHAALVCLGTDLKHGRANALTLERVSTEICNALGERDEPLALVLRGAVWPGTIDRLLVPSLDAACRAGRIRVAVNPEFMRAGASLEDFDDPPMILVGTRDGAAAALVRTLYHGVRAPFVQTSIRTAELIKAAANAYCGLKIRLANEAADLGETLSGDGAAVMGIFRPVKTGAR